MNTKEIVEMGMGLLNRQSFLSLLQEIAENFYPERADFTTRRYLGSEFAANLTTSYPILTRRDLSDQIGTMLRNTSQDWFKIVPEDPDIKDIEAQRWLERVSSKQRQYMYDKKSKFARAVKEGDNDFATFGQCVISVTLNRFNTGLLFRCWHLRDVAWKENADGDIGFVIRKWVTNARELMMFFPNKVSDKVVRLAEKDPYKPITCYHLVFEADLFSGETRGMPWRSIYWDEDHQHEMENITTWNKEYIIPRWQTVSGSQYAYSPATITALPDARLIQAMTYTLLEAGEKATNPPIIATKNVVKSDVSLYAGGITIVDQEYDERYGAALRPLNQDFRGLPYGFEMAQDVRAIIHQAFYLNKLTLPERAPEMTAYEVGQRIQEYVRGALPLFEPMEAEYNGELCEIAFDILFRNGFFGSLREMPPSLSKQNTLFQFESPLHASIDEQKGQKFMEAKGLLAEAFSVDQSSLAVLNVKEALTESLRGIGCPAEWIRSKDEQAEMEAEQSQQQEEQRVLDDMQQSSEIAKNLSEVA